MALPGNLGTVTDHEEERKEGEGRANMITRGTLCARQGQRL